MPKYALGDIVTLITHPFSESNTDIIISGEHLLTPPTMLVSEIISREDATTENPDSYKCVWFSSKKNEFPDHWFNEHDLKKLECDTHRDHSISEGCQVTLKNLDVELGKRRSYLQIDAQGSGISKKTSSISAHLPFVSPVMLVLAVEDFNKEKLKKGVSLKDKIFPTQWVKCKYYNAASEKFSEILLPIEVLSLVPVVSDALLNSLRKIIMSSAYLKFEKTIVKPINVFNKSGYYFLSGFDLIDQKYKDIDLNEMETFTVLKDPTIEMAPKFAVEKTGETKQLVEKNNVKSLINTTIASEDKKHLIIQYSDNFGNVTKRTIDNYEIITGPDDLDSTSTIEYITAFCNLRKAVRNFKLNSISEVSKINIDYPIR